MFLHLLQECHCLLGLPLFIPPRSLHIRLLLPEEEVTLQIQQITWCLLVPLHLLITLCLRPKPLVRWSKRKLSVGQRTSIQTQLQPLWLEWYVCIKGSRSTLISFFLMRLMSKFAPHLHLFIVMWKSEYFIV